MHENQQDEPEIQIIDLNTLPNGSDDIQKAPITTPVPVPTRLLLRSRLTPRQRTIRLLITACLFVFALLLVLGNSPAMHISALSFLFPSTPTPSLAPTATANPNVNQFYIQGMPPWGLLYLDGHSVNVHSDEPIGLPLQISRGHHLFRLLAAPFQPLSCTVSVPIAPTDTCHYTRADMQVSGAWMLTFYESLATLPTAKRQALIAATQAVLDEQQSTTTVQPGEQYVSLHSPGLVNTAKQPLHATLRFHLLYPAHIDPSCLWVDETTNPACATQIRECLLFCPVSDMAPLPGSAISWLVQAAFQPSFDYTTIDNTLVATNQPDALPDVTAAPNLVTLSITWDGTRWHVRIIGPTIAAGNLISCITTENNAAQNLYRHIPKSIGDIIFQFVASSTPANGCLLALFLQTNTHVTPSSTTPAAYFLYRFGLYLAANDMAHLLWPEIPLADTYERTLALQMAAPLFASS